MLTTLSLVRRLTGRSCRTCQTPDASLWEVKDADGDTVARTYLCGECAA